MKNGGAAHHTMKALRIIEITQNASPLGEGAGRRPGIDCLEEAEYGRMDSRPCGIARKMFETGGMLITK